MNKRNNNKSHQDYSSSHKVSRLCQTTIEIISLEKAKKIIKITLAGIIIINNINIGRKQAIILSLVQLILQMVRMVIIETLSKKKAINNKLNISLSISKVTKK